MQIWGVDIKHPSPKDLAIATAMILAYALFCLIVPESGGDDAGRNLPGLVPVAIGAIAASFGLNPGNGWRACILLLIVSAITFVLIQVLLGLLAPV
ncbi:hypothetical protein LNN35_20775 [Pseudomonas stutzeri]|jgi:hypothetical protein|uniref:hypothetical protein n=1 Tax=Stutzerimonas stutzeri TaxID=316 RepID=UPI0015E473FC|nr:hypothetical protein [Stutzerimonas stutzeri]MBA1265443.1 hypothetical protein [Stutzerimonas stutzeri]MCC8345200.1 hypothetical protein [Stutzerimonas stutzeri]